MKSKPSVRDGPTGLVYTSIKRRDSRAERSAHCHRHDRSTIESTCRALNASRRALDVRWTGFTGGRWAEVHHQLAHRGVRHGEHPYHWTGPSPESAAESPKQRQVGHTTANLPKRRRSWEDDGGFVRMAADLGRRRRICRNSGCFVKMTVDLSERRRIWQDGGGFVEAAADLGRRPRIWQIGGGFRKAAGEMGVSR